MKALLIVMLVGLALAGCGPVLYVDDPTRGGDGVSQSVSTTSSNDDDVPGHLDGVDAHPGMPPGEALPPDGVDS